MPDSAISDKLKLFCRRYGLCEKWYNRQATVGWLASLPYAFEQKGGDRMLDFSFADLYSFLITVLGMILAYMAGRRADKTHQRKEPPCGKDSGSFDD